MARALAAQRAHHAHAANAFRGFNAKAAQACRYQRRGAGFFHAQFRMGVDVLPDGDQFRQDRRDFLRHSLVCHAVSFLLKLAILLKLEIRLPAGLHVQRAEAGFRPVPQLIAASRANGALPGIRIRY